MSEQVKFVLGEQDIPTHWVNLMADLPGPTRRAAAAPGHASSPPAPTTWRRCSRWR